MFEGCGFDRGGVVRLVNVHSHGGSGMCGCHLRGVNCYSFLSRFGRARIHPFGCGFFRSRRVGCCDVLYVHGGGIHIGWGMSFLLLLSKYERSRHRRGLADGQ